jgi:uracil-DNA glycosylase family 4
VTTAQAQLDALHAQMRGCRKCAESGYWVGGGPIFAGPASAQVMVVGQAPAKLEHGQAHVPFGPGRGGQRSPLWRWLEQAGWSEADFRARHYFSAITKCYPGKSGSGQGDRVPTAAERNLCRPWVEAELAIVRPRLIIPLGRIAIERFLPELKGQPLEHIIGQSFEREAIFIVPLPHPSGVSRWLNLPQNQARVGAAVTELKRLRQELGIK